MTTADTRHQRTFYHELTRLNAELKALQRDASAREAAVAQRDIDLARRASAIRRLHDAVLGLGQGGDLELTADSLLMHLLAATPTARRASLLVVDGGTGELRVVAAQGFTSPRVLGFVAPRDAGPWWPALCRAEPLVVANLDEAPDLRYAGSVEDLRQARALLAAPLPHDGPGPAGVLVVEADVPGAFDGDDIAVAQAFTALAGLALRMARLTADAGGQAHTDALTGLLNRDGLEAMARREIERARRFGGALVGLILDVDGLAAINDAHGHYVGDQVLARVGARASAAMRALDLIGRHGGDEFAGLMLEVDTARALLVAERIRHGIADTPIPTSVGGLDVTASIGLVALTPDLPDLPALLARADEALRGAKAAGRNRVAAWEA